ncbi:MAG: protein translocase subunit SecD, partial [Gaiellaceae bacterium]
MSERRSHLITVAVIVAALVGVAFLAIPGLPGHKKPHLGLDVQGGLEVTLKAEPTKGQTLTPADLDRSVSIMRNRVDRLGVSEPEIRKQGKDEIVIELAGVKDPKVAASIIGKTAQLEFYDLEADLVSPSIDVQGFPHATTRLYDLLARVQALAKKGTPDTYYLFDAKKKLVAGPKGTKAELLKRRGGTVPKGFHLFAVPPQTVVITCGSTAVVCPGLNGPPAGAAFYLFKFQPTNATKPVPEMTGADLKLSGTRADFDSTSGQPIVLMQFTGKGSKIFQSITRTEAQRGRFRTSTLGGGQPVLQHFAIVLDRQIQSFPSIDFQQYPDGIGGTGGAQITGIRSITEAKNLALVLQTGALPVKFNQIERTDVSATLGKDSLHQAYTAALVGLLVVALFLLLLYRFLGLVAVIGLAIYAAFLYAAILLFNVTITLPGFAGIILTIGVAADANVVVFERIKEEVRAGKSMRAAISHGYAKGFRTILEANVVTAITALVLFAVATAGVKGFALMLLLGTVISLVTAVAATRAMLGLLAGFKWFDKPRFMGAQGQQTAKWLQIDFMSRRNLWFAISGVVIAVGIGALGVRGLNLGIDFKGGTQFTFKTAQPQSVDSVRSESSKIGQAGAVIQGRGAQTNGDYKSFQIRTRSLTSDQQSQLQTDLQDRLQANTFGVKNVSSSFGRQIARLAIIAVIVSLLLIILYIAIRFDFKFALPVIAALIHDLVITVGVYALTGFEVSTATVAAVLTVLGYSIYDTIIIFDRIRENIPLMRRSSFATITNVSLWETIRRSLATTFITLLPVLALAIFGGQKLKDFAFGLLIGITSGAYSSIFIAAPLLAIWKEREPDYRKRIGTDDSPAAEADALVDSTEASATAPTIPALAPAPTAPGTAAEKRERRRQRR